MPRAASEATQLRAAKADIRRLTVERGRAEQQAAAYRARATKAEQEVAEWKKRFDALLKVAGEPK